MVIEVFFDYGEFGQYFAQWNDVSDVRLRNSKHTHPELGHSHSVEPTVHLLMAFPASPKVGWFYSDWGRTIQIGTVQTL